MMEIDQIRRDYTRGGLRRAQLPADPFDLFELWQQQAIDCRLPDPTAMVLATVAEDGQPSQRIVLLKQVDARGFVFYTNYRSRKARELDGNGHASLLFPWHTMERQIKICGCVTRVDGVESQRYFASRPRESQLAAWASPQSAPIDSRDALLAEVARMQKTFANKEQVPLPEFWGGIRVVPDTIEFWQGGAGRLHDCFIYRRQSQGSAWSLTRLAP